MKRYWVGINGSIVVEAENEDEAYHKAYFKALQVLERQVQAILCVLPIVKKKVRDYEIQNRIQR